MSKDLEVLSYLFNSMEGACEKLDKAVGLNNYSETEKLKKIILDMSKRISEELK